MDRKHENLWLCCLTAEQRERTCAYWYTITIGGGTPHTAFRTRAALERWLERTGVHLTANLPDEIGTHQCQKLDGAYIERLHGWYADMPDGRPFVKMSNGQYTEGRVTSENGIRVIHHTNCNDKSRPEYDWRVCRDMEDAGLDGLPPRICELAEKC